MGNLHSTQQRLRNSKDRHELIHEKPVTKNIPKPKIDTTTVLNKSIRTSLPPSPESSLYSNILCQNNKLSYDKSTESYIINGRKYQNFNKKYILPFDEIEQDRLTQVHFLYKHLFDSNFSAPVKDLLSIKHQPSKRDSGSSQYQWLQETYPPRVLDIACGNGAWVLEMATEFPNSQFYGVDIVASYPTTVKPANTYFSQCDILSSNGLPYPDEYFDYIHIRQVYTCFSENDWEAVVKEIKRLLKPGGYVEFRDIDPIMKNMGPLNMKFFERFPHLMKEKQDVNVLWARYMYDILNDIGDLSEIHRTIKQSRFNVPGPIGNLVQTSLRSALESYRLFFEKYNNIPDANYDKVVDNIINEAIQYDSYFEYHCCWGRKSLLPDNEFLHQDAMDINPPTRNRHYSLLKSNNSFQYLPTTISRNHSFNLGSLSNERLKNSSDDIFHYQQSDFSSGSLQDQVVFLGAENVHDIDQFAEGYED